MSDPRQDAFFQHVHKTETCWHWLRTLHGAYGTYRGPGDAKYINAHRYAWQLAGRRALDVNEQLISGCGTKGCVNPEHQQVVHKGSHKRFGTAARR